MAIRNRIRTRIQTVQDRVMISGRTRARPKATLRRVRSDIQSARLMHSIRRGDRIIQPIFERRPVMEPPIRRPDLDQIPTRPDKVLTDIIL